MTIKNSAALITPGMGSSLPPVLNQSLALSGTARQTNTLVPTLPSRSGIVNVKISLGTGTSPTVVALDITATDGTATEQVDSYNPAVAYALGANAVFHEADYFTTDPWIKPSNQRILVSNMYLTEQLACLSPRMNGEITNTL